MAVKAGEKERILGHNKFNHRTEQKVGLVPVALKTKMTMRSPAESICSKARKSCLVADFQERRSSRHTRE